MSGTRHRGGDAARLSANALKGIGKAAISVANRSEERAHEFARPTGADVVPWESLPDALMETDVAITATNSPGYLLTAEDLDQRAHAGRPLVILDLAVPRDVDPAAGHHTDIQLYNVDDIRQLVDDGMDRRRSESGKVNLIITDEIDRFHRWWQREQAAPTIRAVQSDAEALRVRELAAVLRRLSPMDPEDEDILGQFSKSLVRKLLHKPTLAMRDTASHPELLQAATELFGVAGEASKLDAWSATDHPEDTEAGDPR